MCSRVQVMTHYLYVGVEHHKILKCILLVIYIFLKIVSVKFPHALFSLLDFLTLEAGTDMLSWNIGTELPL